MGGISSEGGNIVEFYYLILFDIRGGWPLVEKDFIWLFFSMYVPIDAIFLKSYVLFNLMRFV